MNFNEAEAQKKRLADELCHLFPELSNSEAMGHANHLQRERSIALALQHIENSNNKPETDLKHLLKAAKAMAVAKKSIEELGWYGQENLAHVVAPLLEQTDARFLMNSGARQLSKEALLEKVGLLAEGLREAAAAVNPDAKGVMTAFGEEPEYEGFRESKHKKVAAELLAGECAQLFYKIAGSKPTVANKQVTVGYTRGQKAYGPFLHMVTVVFNVLGEDGSPETWAKKAVKNFSPRA